MNVNFGLFPPIVGPQSPARARTRGDAKRRAISARALADLDAWLAPERADAAE